MNSRIARALTLSFMVTLRLWEIVCSKTMSPIAVATGEAKATLAQGIAEILRSRAYAQVIRDQCQQAATDPDCE